jgi:hypothetical protein
MIGSIATIQADLVSQFLLSAKWRRIARRSGDFDLAETSVAKSMFESEASRAALKRCTAQNQTLFRSKFRAHFDAAPSFAHDADHIPSTERCPDEASGFT